MAKEIKESIDSIREECDELEKKIKPKIAKTRGDPVVVLVE